jgi:hypothetical protein
LKGNGDRIWAGPRLDGRRWSGGGGRVSNFRAPAMSTAVGGTTTLGVAPGSPNCATIAALRTTLQRRRVRPPVLLSAMLRFSAIGTADIRRSQRREISVDQTAAARRGPERRLHSSGSSVTPISVSTEPGAGQNYECAVQRARAAGGPRYVSLETIAPMSEDSPVKLPVTAA